MRGEDLIRKLRVFIAGPSDVAEEKNSVRAVIEELNRPGGTTDKLGFHLQPIEGKQAVPGAGRPQNVILKEMPVETWDVFVGILWCRFGTPTGEVDNKTGRPYESGTEEEFIRAYEQYIKTGWPRIMIYRCQRPILPYQVDTDQLALVKKFFDRLSPKGDDPCLWKPFTSTTELERLVRQDLTNLLHKLKDDVTGRLEPANETVLPAAQIGQIPSHEAAAGPASPTLISGQSYELSVLSIDICRHSDLVLQYPAESRMLLANFRTFVNQHISDHQGICISWTPDGGIFTFEGVNRADLAALTGMALVKNISVFNLDARQNTLFYHGVDIQIRVAANDGPVLYKLPTNEIISSVINDAKKLEAITDPGEFWVLDALHRGMSGAIAAQFSYRTLFRQMKVLGYDGVRSDWPPNDEELEHLVERTESVSESLTNALRTDPLSLTKEKSQQKIEELYLNQNKFLSWSNYINDHWDESSLKKIVGFIQRLLVSEGNFFDILSGRCSSLSNETAIVSIINPIFYTVSARHADRIKTEQLLNYIVGMINRKTVSKSEFRTYTVEDEGISPRIPNAQLQEKVRKLIEADDLHEELALTDLITTERDGLIELIAFNAQIANRKELLQKLWSLSDLVLMEEKIQITGQPIFGRLFASLTEDSWAGRKFTILKRLLEDQEPPYLSKVESLLRTAQTADVEANFDLRMVWRCLLVAHPNPVVVREAARALPRSAIWRTITYSKVPVAAVQALAEVFKLDPSDDERKIFFDCVRPRLLAEITDGATWREVGNLIEQNFYMWKFFIENHYFNRLEDLFSRYHSRAKTCGVNTESFKEMMDKIRAVRIQKNDPRTQIPKGLESLDPAVQRHLARDGCHIDFFVNHTDDRIALETLPFIRLGNIDGLIYLRKINKKLFETILKRDEFFGHSSTILLALNHPKCTPEFSAQYLPRVSAADRAKIANNKNANSVVRERAQLMASR